MRQFFIISGLAILLNGCATSSSPVDVDGFNRADISTVLSARFDASQSEAASALKPSYDKFGTPTRYVSGNMSAIYNSSDDRLYGTGDIYSRFSLSQPIFWQIDGTRLNANWDPIETLHLLYDKDELTELDFTNLQTEVRRGKSFTVFERDVGSRMVVSIYPTEKLSNDADLKLIRFQN